jgi:hypothetical protein
MYQTAAIAFIVVAAAGGAYLAQRPTIASSAGLEQVLRDSKGWGSGYTAYACDDHVPIGVEGARYHCSVTTASGDVERLSCAIYRSGSFLCKADDGSAPPAHIEADGTE